MEALQVFDEQAIYEFTYNLIMNNKFFSNFKLPKDKNKTIIIIPSAWTWRCIHMTESKAKELSLYRVLFAQTNKGQQHYFSGIRYMLGINKKLFRAYNSVHEYAVVIELAIRSILLEGVEKLFERAVNGCNNINWYANSDDLLELHNNFTDLWFPRVDSSASIKLWSPLFDMLKPGSVNEHNSLTNFVFNTLVKLKNMYDETKTVLSNDEFVKEFNNVIKSEIKHMDYLDSYIVIYWDVPDQRNLISGNEIGKLRLRLKVSEIELLDTENQYILDFTVLHELNFPPFTTPVLAPIR